MNHRPFTTGIATAFAIAAAASLAANANAAEDVLRPPTAKTLPAGNAVTHTATIPISVESDVFVTHRGQPEDIEIPWGPRPCKWRGIIPSHGGRNIIVVWHDTCGRHPKITMLSTTATVRVSLHTWYRPRPVFHRPGFDNPTPTSENVELVCELTTAQRVMSRLRAPAPTPAEAVTP